MNDRLTTSFSRGCRRSQPTAAGTGRPSRERVAGVHDRGRTGFAPPDAEPPPQGQDAGRAPPSVDDRARGFVGRNSAAGGQASTREPGGDRRPRELLLDVRRPSGRAATGSGAWPGTTLVPATPTATRMSRSATTTNSRWQSGTCSWPVCYVAFAGACDWDFEPSCSTLTAQTIGNGIRWSCSRIVSSDLTQDQYRWVLQHSKPPVKPVLANRCGFCNAKIDEVATCCSKAGVP